MGKTANTNLKAVEEDGDDDIQEEDALQRLENESKKQKTKKQQRHENYERRKGEVHRAIRGHPSIFVAAVTCLRP